MAEFATVIKELDRMCKSVESCEMGCPLCLHKQVCYEDCYLAVREHPEEAEKIIMQWAAEHPRKTMLQKFRELFPDAPMYVTGHPRTCPTHLGWGVICNGENCHECWNRPYEELKGEKL